MVILLWSVYYGQSIMVNGQTLNSPLQVIHIQAILDYRFTHNLIFITRKIRRLINPLVY